jgi:hypothetical protein
MSSREFTIEEANALVPRLNEVVGDQLTIGDEIQELVRLLWRSGSSRQSTVHQGMQAEVVDITVYPGDTQEVRLLKRQLSDRVQRYRDGWRRVEAMGAVVKDTNTGLLDFYGRLDGRSVWLCWKYGETTIEHYHELDEGFDGRKPLAQIRDRQLN